MKATGTNTADRTSAIAMIGPLTSSMSTTGEFRIPPRQRILEAADDLFRRVGIRGVGVEAIAEAAGTNKMTLYRHFESKDELIAEWVRGIVEKKEAELGEIAAAHPGDPEAQLVHWSRRVAKKFAEAEERGSALGNALAELPERDHPARRVIDEHRIREHATAARSGYRSRWRQRRRPPSNSSRSHAPRRRHLHRVAFALTSRNGATERVIG